MDNEYQQVVKCQKADHTSDLNTYCISLSLQPMMVYMSSCLNKQVVTTKGEIKIIYVNPHDAAEIIL